MNATRHTLLKRACDPNDQHAWTEFVERYRRFIFYILHQVGVPKDEVEDVAQQILLRLTSDLPGYDRSRAKFRTWLSSVIRHAAIDYIKKIRRREVRLAEFEDRSNLDELTEPNESELDLLIENEWTNYVGNLAMERVQKVFQGKAIRVFELGLDGYCANEIARQTGLTTASVYTLRKRVKKRLYLEIRAITAELEP